MTRYILEFLNDMHKKTATRIFIQTDCDAFKRDSKIVFENTPSVRIYQHIYLRLYVNENQYCFIFYFTSFMISSIYMQIAQSGHEVIKRCNDTILSSTILSSM